MLFMLATMEVEAAARRRDTGPLFEQLLGQIARGDIPALEQLYLSSKSAVYGFALSILKNPHSAEDVMQETYVRIYQSAGQYQPLGKPMAWILTIVRNLALSKLRGDSRIQGDYDPQWAESDGGGFTESSIDRLVLQQALAHLADDERQVVMLHSLSGLKHREIAALLGMPLSTALSKYHRALAKLQRLMKEEMA